MPSPASSTMDVAIIGGGVVGCAIARAATLAGYSCTVIEQEADVLHWASGSNSGIACTGVDAKPGTLERALIRDAMSQLNAFLRDMRIPHDPCGSLVCQWPWDTRQSKDHDTVECLQRVMQESHEAGDHAQYLSTTRQILEKEPNMNTQVQGAVHIPGEIVVDPWLYSISLLVQARDNGCLLHTNARVDPSQLSWDGEQWKIPVTTTTKPGACKKEAQKYLYARSIVCATGTWAADWEQILSKRHCTVNTKTDDLKAVPRRGQYRIYHARSSTRIRHPIQPIPTQRTKGIFVFASLYNQIIVGPTALDQSSKTDRSVDPLVAHELDQFAQRIIPDLNKERDLIGEYVGIRPGTNQRDYQIRTHVSPPWICVAGIRSTGLTASLGIGRHVTHLLEQVLRERGISPSPLENPVQIALPLLSDLICNYRERGDGRVEINGHAYKVTHPITNFGWKHYNNT